MPAWFENDAFWEALAPFQTPPDRAADAPHELEQYLQLLDIYPDAPVLDVGCGTGHHAIELARQGFRVTAIDRSEKRIKEARERAAAAGVQVEFVVADMREFVRRSAFEAAFILGETFGIFDNIAEDALTVMQMYESLKPNGQLLIEPRSKELQSRNFAPRTWKRLPDGSILLEEKTVRPGWEWVDAKLVLVSEQGITDFATGYRPYSAVELADLVRRVGFAYVDCYGSPAATPYDHTAERFVFRTRRH